MIESTRADPATDVSVCVVNWNGAEWLPGCLESLRNIREIRHEVLVVDNASSDDSVRIVRERFPEARLLSNAENLGFAAGNNQAIRLGRGRYFFLLNNDTIVQHNSLELLVRFLDEQPRAGMVAGQLVNADGSTQFQYYPVMLPSLASLTADLLWLNRFWPRHHLGRGKLARQWDPSKPSRMEQVPGACMLVRRETLESVGLFDEAHRFLYEDVDFCLRCGRMGWEAWYMPEARIEHRGAASTRLLTVPARSLWRFRSMLLYAGRYFSRRQFSILKGVLILGLVIRLPLALGAGLWPGKRLRQLWKGTWGVYVQLLGEIIRS